MRVTKSQCRKGSFFCGSPIEYPIGAVSQRTLCETLLCHLAVNARPGEAPCPPLAGYPEAIPVPVLRSRSVPSPLLLSLGASPRRLGSFRNLHFSQETGGSRDVRSPDHRGQLRIVAYPEAIPVPALFSRSLPSLHFLSLGASHRGPGSFRNLHGRNLHLSQETGSGPDLRRRGSRRWLF